MLESIFLERLRGGMVLLTFVSQEGPEGHLLLLFLFGSYVT